MEKEKRRFGLPFDPRLLVAAFSLLVLVSCVKGGSSSVSQSSSNTSSGSASASSPKSDSLSVSTEGSQNGDSSGSSSSIEAPLEVYALEQTGQYGDCTLFKQGNYEILVDGGNNDSAPQLVEALKSHVADHVLDLLIVTHPHTDHYGGFVNGSTSPEMGGSLSDGGITSVSKFVDNGVDSYSYAGYASMYVNGFRKYWINKGASYSGIANLVNGHTYDATWALTSSLSVQWLDTGNYVPVGGTSDSDANSNSVACDIRYGTYDFFMAGDLPSSPEGDLLSKYQSHSFLKAGNHVIYKGLHHGSNGANSSALLSFLNPEYSWVSSGITSANSTSAGIKSSQHPYKSARTRIEAQTGTDKLWWNGTAGTLKMAIPSDCSSFSITGVGRHYGDYYVGGTLVERMSEKDLPLEMTKWAQAGF
jgi:beta-lactamase superfamily II metal-dependent hydrolase